MSFIAFNVTVFLVLLSNKIWIIFSVYLSKIRLQNPKSKKKYILTSITQVDARKLCEWFWTACSFPCTNVLQRFKTKVVFTFLTKIRRSCGCGMNLIRWFDEGMYSGYYSKSNTYLMCRATVQIWNTEKNYEFKMVRFFQACNLSVTVNWAKRLNLNTIETRRISHA